MKIGQDFERIGSLGNGELVLKLPGTDFKMVFEGGKAYLSDNLTIGYVSLPVKKIDCQENGEPKGMFGELGRQMAEQLMAPMAKTLLDKVLSSRDMSLFYSMTERAIEIISLPGMSAEEQISEENGIPNMVLAIYSLNSKIPSAERVYALHLDAVGDRRHIRDRATLENEVLRLVSKVNGVYEKSLQLMRDSEF